MLWRSIAWLYVRRDGRGKSMRVAEGNFSSEECSRLTAYKTTIKDVRHYSIKMMNGFSTFKCPLCKHLVTTREFSSQNGNCRTQAARSMNEHAAAAHGQPGPKSPRYGQMRHAY